MSNYFLKFYGSAIMLFFFIYGSGKLIESIGNSNLISLAIFTGGFVIYGVSQYFLFKAIKDKSYPGTKAFAASFFIFTIIVVIAAFLDANQKIVVPIFYGLLFGSILQALKNRKSDLPKIDGDTGKDSDIKVAGSRLNPRKLLNGYLWSTPQQLKNFSTQPNNTVYIDEFRYYPDTLKSLDSKVASKVEKETVVKFAPLDFTKTILVLGGMGSGKTEWILSVANQRQQFGRQFFHDTKGDFTQKLCDPETDFIFNPYDSRSVVWDIWTELEDNETLAVAFFKSLMSAASKKDDFWSVRSGDIVSDIALDVFDDDSIPKNEKWLALSHAIEDWLNDATAGDGATKKSLAETVDMVKDICYLMAFQEHNGARRFTIKEWLETDTRLFLLNNPAYAEKLTPLFTGFIAVLSSILLSKPDTKEDLTLMVLDEFFALKFDEITRSNLLTQVRSKGGCLIIGAQYMPLKDKAEQQQIDSSRYAMILFQINDGETIKHVSGLFGSVEFMRTDVSVSEGTSKNSGSGGGSNLHGAGIFAAPLLLAASAAGGKSNSKSTNISTSERERKEDFLTPELLASMPQYHHITYIPSEKIVYLGYTEQAGLSVKNENFVSIDSRSLRKFKKGAYVHIEDTDTIDEDEMSEFNFWTMDDQVPEEHKDDQGN